jgi:Phage integrase, N-terminal SAM-like domain
LTEWLTTKADIRASTLRSYTAHVQLHLRPHLGSIPLAQLRAGHVQAMFGAIGARNQQIVEENASRRAVEQTAQAAWKAGDRMTARFARARLATMPPDRRPAGVATLQRIRGTLRSALSDAAAQHLVTANVAKLVKLPAGRRPRPLVWTEERVAHWRKTGQRPSR